jgi:hypothetical protein
MRVARRAPARPERALRWTVVWATAASVLAIAWAIQKAPPSVHEPVVQADGWGWVRPGALPQDTTRAGYLNRLADAAVDWFHTRPDDAVGLAWRLGELRQGCSFLILSEHHPLTADDRAWLTENCRAWAARFDGYLIALEAGADPLIIRRQADRTIDHLIQTLRERAKSP